MLIINLFLINFYFSSQRKSNGCFLSKSAALRPRAYLGQYRTLLDQSDCIYFV